MFCHRLRVAHLSGQWRILHKNVLQTHHCYVYDTLRAEIARRRLRHLKAQMFHAYTLGPVAQIPEEGVHFMEDQWSSVTVVLYFHTLALS
jgi:hypothetical protein